MTDAELKAYAREQIAEKITVEYCKLACKVEYQDCLKCSAWEIVNKLADQILALTKPDGTRLLGIVSDEQKPKDVDHHLYENAYEFELGRDWMLTENYVRLVKDE